MCLQADPPPPLETLLCQFPSLEKGSLVQHEVVTESVLSLPPHLLTLFWKSAFPPSFSPNPQLIADQFCGNLH